MTSFLFWNLMGRQERNLAARRSSLRAHITQMAKAYDVDVFMFAESVFTPGELTAALNDAGRGAYCFPPNDSRRLYIFTRLPASSLVPQFDDLAGGRLTIRRLRTPGSAEILLAVLHFRSQLHWSPGEQALEVTALRGDIVQAEDAAGHQRTIVVGDLNMNPFDLGVVGAQALNAVMTRELARRMGRLGRIVAGKPYRCFYNPMWGCFGDRSEGPAGTFFHGAGSPGSTYWSVIDQVLLRPELMDALSFLRILEDDGVEPLVTRSGRPKKVSASDHLPILFRLNL